MGGKGHCSSQTLTGAGVATLTGEPYPSPVPVSNRRRFPERGGARCARPAVPPREPLLPDWVPGFRKAFFFSRGTSVAYAQSFHERPCFFAVNAGRASNQPTSKRRRGGFKDVTSKIVTRVPGAGEHGRDDGDDAVAGSRVFLSFGQISGST